MAESGPVTGVDAGVDAGGDAAVDEDDASLDPAGDRARYDTGLILAMPQLAQFTSRWRSTSYADDQPAIPIERRFPPHVTLLTPWAPPDDTEALERVQVVARRSRPFTVTFSAAQLFPDSGVVWLRPDPHPALDALLDDVGAAFPEYPSYGGIYDDVIAHLTVSTHGGPTVLEEVSAALERHGPLHADVERICLFARGEDEIWGQVVAVELGSGELVDRCVQPRSS